ncbi:hypothetical protein, partial [Micromonospora sp. S-DT3-3-22]|uniref:hypothetical protein n=1 Tax=Micromonospora sp. S-DT3-3-22 TaxID=2755359 RepID=UPI001E497C0D
MGQLQLTQIERRVKQAILPHLDVSDVGQYKPEDRDRLLLSRSLAAFIVSKLGDLGPETAAQTITDGAHDNGIDALVLQRQLVRGSRVVGSGRFGLGVGVVCAIGTRPRRALVGGLIA